MTANKLAFEVENWEYEIGTVFSKKVATMLRQQQAEIEALKKEAALQRLSDFTQEVESFDRTASHMAGEYVSYNEPYIWMDDLGTWFTNEDYQNLDKKGIFPLYTHPAKTLTNEEIKTIFYETGDLFDFARAILRKAQEK